MSLRTFEPHQIDFHQQWWLIDGIHIKREASLIAGKFVLDCIAHAVLICHTYPDYFTVTSNKLMLASKGTHHWCVCLCSSIQNNRL